MRQHYIRKTQTAVLRKKERRVKEMTVKRGDIFYADLSPVVGSEQGGLRPVLIVQNDVGNKYSPTVIAAAITSRMDKAKLPTHIDVSLKDRAAGSPGLARDSVVLLEQIRTLDKKRLREKMGHLPPELMESVDRALFVSFGLVARAQPGDGAQKEKKGPEEQAVAASTV